MRKVNLLTAYPYTKPSLVDAIGAQGDKLCWLLDSGAFTAWKSGKPIKLDDYCRYLDALPVRPWKYFALDVVGDHVNTMKNFREMIKRGYKPMPVFTPGQPPEDLEEYYAHADLVGFGGITTKSSNATRNYIALMMQRAQGRNVHLLGYTSVEWLKVFKPFSCDSTTWATGSTRFGHMQLYMGNGKSKTLTREDCTARPPSDIMNRIRKLGVDPMRLQSADEWRNMNQQQTALRQVSTASWLLLMWDVEKHLKTKLFLACGSAEDVSSIMARAAQMHGSGL